MAQTGTQGAPLKTLDDLYKEAQKLPATKLSLEQRLYVAFAKRGLLESCFCVDTRIADDAPRSPEDYELSCPTALVHRFSCCGISSVTCWPLCAYVLSSNRSLENGLGGRFRGNTTKTRASQ